MKLRFFGTGLGGCRVKKRLSKDCRRDASLLLDDGILVDLTADTVSFAEEFGVADLLSGVKTVVLARPHALSADAVLALSKKSGFTLYSPASLAGRLPAGTHGFAAVEFSPFWSQELPGYRVLALPFAREGDLADTYGLLFLGEKNLFLLPEGGDLAAQGFKCLAGLHLDAVVAGADLGLSSPPDKTFFHGTLDSRIRLREILLSAGIADAKTRFVLTGFPTGKGAATHEELADAAQAAGFVAAYDGYFCVL